MLVVDYIKKRNAAEPHLEKPSEQLLPKSSTLKVVFLLPGSGHRPVGGFKVVYEYANHLAQHGHTVEVHHISNIHPRLQGLKRGIKFLKYTYGKAFKAYLPSGWFALDRNITPRWLFEFDPQYLKDCDVIVATAWQTAFFLKTTPQWLSKSAYLIQHEEFWSGSEEEVKETWAYPLQKIVISRWLQRSLETEGETGIYIPNGLDFKRFYMKRPIRERTGNPIMMLYHDLDWKGSADGLKALEIVKESHPEIQVTLFGVPNRPKIPDWMEYHQLPTQSALLDLYNTAGIFVAPSWAEGWPLPPAEAMMCGAALVATDIGGHREYAIDGETALLAQPRDPQDLAQKIIRLLENPVLRHSIAQKGNEYIQQFTWQRAGQTFENTLRDIAKTHALKNSIQ
ncbi:MAG: glycosyltransferase family 4 protein [Deinococcaceae bacterium]